MTGVISGQRLWRTADGELVPDGHPDAAFLAYGPGDQVPDADAKGLKLNAPTENKLVEPQENKGSGLTIDTRDSVIAALEDLGVKVDRRKGTDTLRSELETAKAAASEGDETEEDPASEEE